MSSESYADLGGSYPGDVPAAYREHGAWWRACVKCGAPAESRCIFEGRPKGCPCLARLGEK